MNGSTRLSDQEKREMREDAHDVERANRREAWMPTSIFSLKTWNSLTSSLPDGTQLTINSKNV
jgi:hypothetical protein